MFCWHKWARWSAPKIVQHHLQGDDGEVIVMKCNIQERTCEKCNKYQTRPVELK